ncbi:MAG: hypothetical protein K5678_12385 [Acetatifactor sp.]|nr:hypothetical protein [Acetatifactor sp.]
MIKKLKSFWAWIGKSLDMTLLIKWVLVSEILSCSILLNVSYHMPMYKDLKYEGYYSATIDDYADSSYHVKREHTIIPINWVRCLIDYDGTTKSVYVEAIDILGTNSLDYAKKCAKMESRVWGYLYTAEGGKYKFFYRNLYNDKDAMLRGGVFGKLEWYFYTAKEWRTIMYVIVGIVLLLIAWAKRWKGPFYSYTKKDVAVAKDNYSNKAISQNNAYTLLTWEAFEKRYPADIKKVAYELKWNEFHVSSDQRQAIENFFLNKKSSETIGDYVDPRIFGSSVAAEVTGGYVAQSIYRIYRESTGEAEADVEPVEAPEEIVPDDKKRRRLKGPIIYGNTSAREAILVKVSPKIPFVNKRKVRLLERTKEGQFAEHRIKADYCYARAIPGNRVMVVSTRRAIGVYEDVLKNEENPIMKDYEEFMMKIHLGRVGRFIQQSVLFLFSIYILLFAAGISYEWLLFPAATIMIVGAASFKHMVHLLGRKYVKKYGPIVYEAMFHKLWKIPYVILLALAVVAMVEKYILFGFWG